MTGESCDCPCHDKNVSMRHCMPCCSTCQHCKKRIRHSYHARHEEICFQKRMEILFESLSYGSDDDIVWVFTAKTMKEELKNNTDIGRLFTKKVIKEAEKNDDTAR